MAPGSGIWTLVTAPTGSVAPFASTMALGTLAEAVTATVNVLTALTLPVSVVVTTMVSEVATATV